MSHQEQQLHQLFSEIREQIGDDDLFSLLSKLKTKEMKDEDKENNKHVNLSPASTIINVFKPTTNGKIPNSTRKVTIFANESPNETIATASVMTTNRRHATPTTNQHSTKASRYSLGVSRFSRSGTASKKPNTISAASSMNSSPDMDDPTERLLQAHTHISSPMHIAMTIDEFVEELPVYSPVRKVITNAAIATSPLIIKGSALSTVPVLAQTLGKRQDRKDAHTADNTVLHFATVGMDNELLKGGDILSSQLSWSIPFSTAICNAKLLHTVSSSSSSTTTNTTSNRETVQESCGHGDIDGILDSIADYCFPDRLPVVLEHTDMKSTTDSHFQQNNNRTDDINSDNTNGNLSDTENVSVHIMQFSDANGVPTYACCLVLTERIPVPSVGLIRTLLAHEDTVLSAVRVIQRAMCMAIYRKKRAVELMKRRRSVGARLISSFSTPFKFGGSSVGIVPTTAKKTAFTHQPTISEGLLRSGGEYGSKDDQDPATVAGVEGDEQGDHMLMSTNGGGGGIGSVFFNRLKKTFASTTKKSVRGGGSNGGVHFDDEPPLISMVANTALGRWLSPEGKHGRGSVSSSGNDSEVVVTDSINDCRDRADSSVCGTPSIRLDSTTKQQQQQQSSPSDADPFLEESNAQNKTILASGGTINTNPISTDMSSVTHTNDSNNSMSEEKTQQSQQLKQQQRRRKYSASYLADLHLNGFSSGSDDDDNGDDGDKSKGNQISRGFVFDDDDDVDGVDGRSLPAVVDSEFNDKDNSRDQLQDGMHEETKEERKEEDTSDDISQYSNYVVVTRKAYCVLSTHPQAAYPALFQALQTFSKIKQQQQQQQQQSSLPPSRSPGSEKKRVETGSVNTISLLPLLPTLSFPLNHHNSSSRRLEEWSLAVLFTLLPPTVVVKILSLLLLEQSLVVCGSDCGPGLVSTVTTAVTLLIRPFSWAGILVPILPDNARQVMEAPVPFIVGTMRAPLSDEINPCVAVLHLDDFLKIETPSSSSNNNNSTQQQHSKEKTSMDVGSAISGIQATVEGEEEQRTTSTSSTSTSSSTTKTSSPISSSSDMKNEEIEHESIGKIPFSLDLDDDGYMAHDGINGVDESVYITYAYHPSSDFTPHPHACSAASTVQNNNHTSSSWYPYMNNDAEAMVTTSTTANAKHSIMSSYGKKEKQYLCIRTGNMSHGQSGPTSGDKNGFCPDSSQGMGGQGVSSSGSNHPAQLLLIEQLRRVRRQLHGIFLAEQEQKNISGEKKRTKSEPSKLSLFPFTATDLNAYLLRALSNHMTNHEYRMVRSAIATIHTFNTHLCGELPTHPAAWQRYGRRDSSTQLFDFYPEMFLAPRRAELAFQEGLVHTQLFVSYLDEKRSEYDARIQSGREVRFIADWLWFRWHLLRTSKRTIVARKR